MKSWMFAIFLGFSLFFLCLVIFSPTVPRGLAIAGWIGTFCGNAILFFDKLLEGK